jgi:hypothetical protein
MITVMSDAAWSVAKHRGVQSRAKPRLSTTGHTWDTEIRAQILLRHLIVALQKLGACEVQSNHLSAVGDQ